jgi:uncharacterized coiled-coil protein SlyX
VELEVRIARVELTVKAIHEAVDVVMRRLAALQAQLDHLAARVERR